MASEQKKKEAERAKKESLRVVQAAKDTQAETDQFKCGKCHHRKTTYYQLQTRSADEPMTTFVTCVNCGHKWRVSLFFYSSFVSLINNLNFYQVNSTMYSLDSALFRFCYKLSSFEFTCVDGGQRNPRPRNHTSPSSSERRQLRFSA